MAGLARDGRYDEAKELWWQHPIFETARTSGAGQVLHDGSGGSLHHRLAGA